MFCDDYIPSDNTANMALVIYGNLLVKASQQQAGHLMFFFRKKFFSLTNVAMSPLFEGWFMTVRCPDVNKVNYCM